jgi:hypothetical protein
MEIQGAAYFYALAAAAMAFSAFSAIVIIIRQTMGAGLTPFQLALTRVFIERGFYVALLSFLPMLLAIFELPHILIWQICSAAAALILAAWHLDDALRRYPAVRTKRQPKFACVNWAITSCAVLMLVCNAASVPYSTQAGPYALAIAWILIQGGEVFILSLGSFLHKATSASKV